MEKTQKSQTKKQNFSCRRSTCKDHAYQSSPSNCGVSKHLCNRGKLGVFIGYLPKHPPGTWKFYNPENKSIFKSRDVLWLNIMWGDYNKI